MSKVEKMYQSNPLYTNGYTFILLLMILWLSNCYLYNLNSSQNTNQFVNEIFPLVLYYQKWLYAMFLHSKNELSNC